MTPPGSVQKAAEESAVQGSTNQHVWVVKSMVQLHHHPGSFSCGSWRRGAGDSNQYRELCSSTKGSCEHAGALNTTRGEGAEEMLLREHLAAFLPGGNSGMDSHCHRTKKMTTAARKKKNPNIFTSWKNSFLNAPGNQITTFLSHVSKADDASEQCGTEITANLACNSPQLNSTYCTRCGSTRLSFQFTALSNETET